MAQIKITHAMVGQGNQVFVIDEDGFIWSYNGVSWKRLTSLPDKEDV